jgi:MoaA/NifB/PqqE/SkfB family radical SAM enzyme
LEDARKVLRVIRTATENIVFTGGEPLMHRNIEEIVAYARELKFHTISLITNGLLLRKREGVLNHLTRLVVSLDSLDVAAWDRVLAGPPGSAEKIIRHIEEYSMKQKQYGYRMAINCVVLPHTVPMVREVIKFCLLHDLSFSLNPQGVNDQPHSDLAKMPEYRALIQDIQAMKKSGRNVLGSAVYLATMLDFQEFQCYPTVNIRVMQNGDFVYPCRPIADRHDGTGGVACNLLNFDNFQDALALAVERFGPPPKGCRSCFQQCFAEPSLFIDKPLSMLSEVRSYMTPR